MARGVAILQMVAFHFCYDLNHFGWLHVAMLADPRWIAWRSAIVTQFLFLVGISMILRGGIPAGAGAPVAPRADRRFWRRWAQIAACAAIVSVVTRPLFGPRFIWFGILHFVAAAELLVVAAARRPPPIRDAWGIAALAAAGFAAIAMGLLVHFAVFDADAWSWIGFAADKPATEDFVPILPWLGVVLLGMAAGAAWRRHAFVIPPTLRRANAPGGIRRLPAFLGRWPLTVYMVHQPILFGALSLLRLIRI